MYQTIRSAAYEPDPDHGPWLEDVQVLRLGEQLHAELVRRAEEAHGSADQPVRLPVNRLNSLLRAMAPGVVATGRNAGTDGRLPWLYAREPVPLEVLAPLVGTWAADLSGPADAEGEETDLEELLSGDPVAELLLPDWETEPVDLTETVVSAGGTAEPLPRLYNLLPEWVAHRLAARQYRVGGVTFHFRVVTARNGVELVSWPPRRYEKHGQTWYYSARVGIVVHTVPFAPRFRVHVSTGIRRWATRIKLAPYELTGATVLLDAPLPWPEGPDRSHRLMPNTLGYDRRAKALAWRRHSPALLLPELDIVRRYPEPSELFGDPERWLNGRGDVAAGIVFHPVIGPHEVAPGLMPVERAELDAWVEEGLRPVLRRVDDLTRVTRDNTPSLLPRSVRKGEPDTRETRRALMRRAALARALAGRPLDVEIRWQSEETREALLAELPGLIGLPPGSGSATGDNTWQWRTEDIEITVRARPAGALADALQVSGNRKRPRALRLADAVEDRCALVAGQDRAPRGEAGLVIAEIAGKGGFSTVPDTDPKHALRLGWARQGQLSQFVNLPEDTAGTLEHRARWTWLDAFRQLGAVSPPAHRAGAGIPGDLQYVALWLVRYTRKGPTCCPARRLVAVRVRPGDGTAAIDGWDAARSAWVPYPQLLLSLAQDAEREPQPVGPAHGRVPGAGVEQHWQQEVERQIRVVLFQLRDRPTLLLVDAGNLRQGWPRLRNGALARDVLGFGGEPDQQLAVYGHDLRVVVVRDGNNRDETAEWYALGRSGETGFAEGVWGTGEPEDRVFASTASRPHTAKGAKGLRKLVPGAEARTAPGKPAWNPVQLELNMLGCLSEKALADSGREGVTPDRPAEWATLAHQLRYHDDYPPLGRPLPLHLARLTGQYVLPLAREKGVS
ncbi:pPIWI_RE module domain-containing protein [Streptacidiphilus sp. N1-3]|uniref:PPIWI_RE module domain-containing protein n=1 Tax=Streptacidiphilus alkalitolerans TaxID=3342712 RepID=A0ABV6WX46_9ACTN